MSNVIAYRPDIDGLRAVAILPVVLFHLGVAGVTGGFVGVDIFFVISGFLITSIIHNEIESGSFRMKQFWVRRARRILPAMFVLILLTLLGGWYLLPPSDYADLGRSARYQSLFGANFFFWQQSGYFDAAAESKPLLHMWSLAVEEQFYFFFPLLLLLIRSFFPAARLGVLLALAIASFALSAWSIQQESSAAFYLLPMRAWELLAGGLLVFLPPSDAGQGQRLHLVAIAGFLAILCSIFLYDPKTPFPGPAALLPVLGAGLVIWAGPDTLIARMLSVRPVVFAGLLSYSWYLWHWPLIVFVRTWQVEPLTLQQQALLFFTSLLLAYGSYRLVEEPFRRRKLLGTDTKILVAAAVCILITFVIAQQIRRHEGFPERLPEAAQKFDSVRHRDKQDKRCEKLDADDLRNGNFCKLGAAQQGVKPLVISWGDSHSSHYLPLYETFASEHQISFWHTSRITCSPVAGKARNAECASYNQAVRELIARNRIPHVILASRWARQVTLSATPVGEEARKAFREDLEKVVRELRAMGCTVWLVKQVPEHPFEPPKYLALLAMQGKDTAGLGVSFAEHTTHQAMVNSVIDEVAQQEGVHLLDPAAIMCADQKVCRTEFNGESFYRDGDHLSPAGALYLKPMLDPLVDYLQKKP